MGKPYLAVLKANHVSGLVVSANSWPGALGVMHPASSDNTSSVCANRFGVPLMADLVCP
jgi:hypothetical protein